MKTELYIPLRDKIAAIVPEIRTDKNNCEHCEAIYDYRDITLADVLIAIQKIDQDYPIHMNQFFGDEGYIRLTLAKGHPIINTDCEWNLALPLHLQEDSVGEWLMTVIK